MDVVYDGRVSDECAGGCTFGDCGESLPGLACGGCCGCLGGCEIGYHQQIAELADDDTHNTQDPDEYHDRCVDMELEK